MLRGRGRSTIVPKGVTGGPKLNTQAISTDRGILDDTGPGHPRYYKGEGSPVASHLWQYGRLRR